MKRIASLLLAVCLLAGTVSCSGPDAVSSSAPADDASAAVQSEGGESQTETKELSGTLTYLSWSGETNDAPIIQAYQEKYPNVTVDFQYAPPPKDYVEKLNTQLYSGTAPDVFIICPENRQDLIDGDYVVDLSDRSYMQGDYIPEKAKTVYGSGDQIFGLVVEGWIGGIYYNVDIFQKAGITEEPQTWDEFLDVCQKLQDAGYKPLIDGIQDAAALFVGPLFAAETKTQDPDFTQKVYAGEKTFADGWTKPVQMWYELIERGFITPDMVGITADQMISEFATEQCALVITGPWMENQMESINPDLNYKVMGVPGSEEGNIWFPGAYNYGYAINKNAKNPELAEAFLEVIADQNTQAELQKQSSYLEVTKGYENPVTPANEAAVTAFEEGKFDIPVSDWYQHSEAIRIVMVASLQDCITGKIPPEQVAQNMDAKLQELMG